MSDVKAEVTGSRQESHRVAALRGLVASSIPCEGDAPSLRQHLQTARLIDLLRFYMAWVDRCIPPRPRDTVFASAFWNGSVNDDQLVAISKIAAASKAGEDLNRFLSHYVFTHGFTVANVTSVKGKRWSDGGRGNMDFALNTLGLHHLHLSPSETTGKRKGPSSDLLFCDVGRHTLRFIYLGDHKSFDSMELRHRAASDRADRGLVVKGLSVPKGERRSDEDTRRLARAGFMVPEIVDGKFVAIEPVANDGSNMFHTRHADKIVSFLRDWDEKIDTQEGRRDLASRMEVSPNFFVGARWGLFFGDFGIVSSDGIGICILPWNR